MSFQYVHVGMLVLIWGVYPSLNLEEARALLPRDTKQLIYMAQTHYLSN
ncbi:arsenate reductase-like glutaredoxin family protein [Streptococcus pneumoniae]|nr:arsenate reductase-like glutaredoxin family protein [Streptococcus pneumoniae]